METIRVLHTGFGDNGDCVALVMVDENLSLPEKLEYAFRWTNSTHGSWSHKVKSITEDGKEIINHDYNEDVIIVKPLEVDENGKEWGHRSTSVGDQMEINYETYVVAKFGFETLEGERVR